MGHVHLDQINLTTYTIELSGSFGTTIHLEISRPEPSLEWLDFLTQVGKSVSDGGPLRNAGLSKLFDGYRVESLKIDINAEIGRTF